jgi:hypothetical protein
MLYLYTWPLKPFQNPPIPSLFGFCSKHLILLALPLEAEGLVDPEFSGDGEEGHANGDAASISDDLCYE